MKIGIANDHSAVDMKKQIVEYLNYYHLEKGYLLSFNFNKNKKSGMKTLQVNGKTVIEAVV